MIPIYLLVLIKLDVSLSIFNGSLLSSNGMQRRTSSFSFRVYRGPFLVRGQGTFSIGDSSSLSSLGFGGESKEEVLVGRRDLGRLGEISSFSSLMFSDECECTIGFGGASSTISGLGDPLNQSTFCLPVFSGVLSTNLRFAQYVAMLLNSHDLIRLDKNS